MKVYFIVVGWYYNQKSLLEDLKSMEENNKFINVFYSCHKDPPEFVKENFDWKLFDNLGEEFVAYQQAIKYLNIEDEAICFFMNDDIIVKDWEFISECVNKLNQGYKIVGNGYNPGFNAYNPFYDISIGISEEFDGRQGRDYAHEKNKYLFDDKLEMNMVRGSFFCIQYKTVKEIGGLEPREEAWVPMNFNENGKPYYRGFKDVADTKTGGLGLFGNLFPNLTLYKINKVFGKESVTWLGEHYRNSEYLYEYERGED